MISLMSNDHENGWNELYEGKQNTEIIPSFSGTKWHCTVLYVHERSKNMIQTDQAAICKWL